MNGCDETVHHEPFPLNLDHPIASGRPDEAWIVCVIKRINRRPFDRDRTAEMRSAPTYLDRYNSFKNATCVLFDRGPRSRDRRTRSSAAPTIQRFDVCHVACILEHCVGL